MTRRNSRLRLNTEDKKFLGVCAGIADYLGIAPWTVRLALIIAVLFGGWFMIPLYFVAWFCMDKDTAAAFKRGLGDSPALSHLKNVDYRKRIYRNRKDGKVLGVCAGIADYLEVDVTIVRIITLAVMLLSGFIAVIIYVAAYFILDDKPRPSQRFDDNEYRAARETLNETLDSASISVKHCSRRFSALHERLARMEAYVTSKHFRLHREFKNID